MNEITKHLEKYELTKTSHCGFAKGKSWLTNVVGKRERMKEVMWKAEGYETVDLNY